MTELTTEMVRIGHVTSATSAESFDQWIARVQADAWSAGHVAALHNLRWPRERRSNPYLKEQPEKP